MKKLAGLSAGLCLVFSGCIAMVAQDGSSSMPGPPKVLVIQREFVKPGRNAAHEKSESSFVSAFAAAKWPTHYFAAESLSGRPRVLFFVGYPSFEAWEKDNHAIQKNAALSATLDKLNVVDGDLLEEFGQSVWTYDSDGSLHVGGDVAKDRYFEVSQYKVKPGHRAEFKELVKLYQNGFADVPEVTWALFESSYGQDNGGLYLAITPMKTLAEDDANMNVNKKLEDKLGPEGMKKLRELTASCLDSEQTNLFEFNPKMSYVWDEWVKADPSFWKPKAAAPMAAKKPVAPAAP
jgi:hypothetical protein